MTPSEQIEFRSHLYQEINSHLNLQLKYQIFPFSGGNNYAGLPVISEYQKVLLALRPPAGVDRDMSKFSVVFGDPLLHPRVAKMGEVVPYSFEDSNSERKLPIRLFSPVDVVRTAEFDLVIIAHTVRLMVLPTVSSVAFEMLQWALGLAAVTFVMLVIGASGTDLWLRRKISWCSRRFLKKRRRPSRLAKVKGGVV